MTSEKKVRELLTKIARRARRIDILVNNAGYCGPLARIEKIFPAELMEHLKQNLLSAF